MLLVWCLVIVAISVIHIIGMDIRIIVIRIMVCVDAVLRRVQQRGLWLQKPVKLGCRGPRADPHGRHSWRPLTKAWRRSCRHASENAQLSNRLGWRCNWINNLRLRRGRACLDRFRLWRPMATQRNLPGLLDLCTHRSTKQLHQHALTVRHLALHGTLLLHDLHQCLLQLPLLLQLLLLQRKGVLIVLPSVVQCLLHHMLHCHCNNDGLLCISPR